MFTFSQWTNLRRSVHFQLNDTRQERCRFCNELAETQITRGDFDVFYTAYLKILFGRVSALR